MVRCQHFYIVRDFEDVLTTSDISKEVSSLLRAVVSINASRFSVAKGLPLRSSYSLKDVKQLLTNCTCMLAAYTSFFHASIRTACQCNVIPLSNSWPLHDFGLYYEIS
jgi:hypothetical protein